MATTESTSGTATSSLALIGSEIKYPNQGGKVNVSVYNDGTAALNAFEVDLKHPDGTYYTFLSGANFVATNIAILLFCSGTPTTIASGGESHFHFDAGALTMIRFRASTASGTAALRIYVAFE